ncbi:MAG: hypothetical protein ACE5JX_23120 [Acidobacteriota bacterium]
MYRILRRTLSPVVASAVVLLFTLPLAAGDHPDFSGTWRMNPDKSDAPPRMGGRGGNRGEGEQSGEISLIVSQVGETLNVVRKGGAGGRAEMALRPGAGAQEVSTPRGQVTVEAHWDGHILVVKQTRKLQTRRGEMKIEQEQKWELSEDGNTLTQRVKIKSRRGDSHFNLIFDKQG